MLGQATRVSSTTRALLLLLGAFLTGHTLLVERAFGDLLISGYQDRLHDRFYVGSDSAFIGAGYNWSGIGRLPDPAGGGTNWKHVAMISDNYVITTNHNRPNRGDDPLGSPPVVRFYRTNDPNGEYWESPLATSNDSYVGQQIGATDLWVGKLASTPPSWVMRYPLAKRHEATNYLSYTDNDLFIFGQDSPRSYTSVRVGRNEIDSVNGDGDFQWSYEPTAGFGDHEAQTVSGDSGGPSFFLSGNVPVLAGVHTRTNFDTGISANIDDIMAVIGEPVSLSTGLVGDLNGDFRVNSSDFFRMFSKLSTRSPGTYGQGDLNGDGIVGVGDLSMFSSNYNRTLFAPSDFDRDGDVDSGNLSSMGDNWLKAVSAPYTVGDANGDSYVNLFDLMVFDRNQNRGFFGPLPPPLSPITGDLDGNGIVNEIDSNIVTANLNRKVTPGTLGDLNFNGTVEYADLNVVASAVGDSFGDINGDHEVGPGDFVILANNWNRVVTGGRLSGDMNFDGRVNSLDASVLFDWWGVQGMTLSGAAVPEPSSVLLWLLASILTASFCRVRQNC